MLIDYIYLLLILVLICCIIFLIFLSYEYRVNEGFVTKIPNITSIANIDDTSKTIMNDSNKILDKLYTYGNNIYNANVIRDNSIIYDLEDKASHNLINAKKLKNINDFTLPDSKFPVDKMISTIKSRYNSQYLSTFASDVANYGVLANDKCLTVNGLCKEDFCLLDCQKKSLTGSISQKFSTKRIHTADEASRAAKVDINTISSKNVYPFNIFTSLVNNNCLTISDNGVTVEKCNLNNIKQQWDISPDENICVLE